MTKKIAIMVGSLRKDSWNRKLALALMKLAPPTLDMEIIDIGSLPLYNQDLDDDSTPPKTWTAFREKLKSVDGLLFVTPEYNRSVPAPLKNAIDVGSRPYGQSIWDNKPGAVISTSPGAIGGFGANQHLRQSFVFLNIPCLQQPEAYVGDIAHILNEDGSIAKKETEQFLKNYMHAFDDWVNKFQNS